MTRVDFYFNAPDKLDVARRLAGKAFLAGQHTLLYTPDETLAQNLDRALWVEPAAAFLPHVRCGHPLAPQTPVQIGVDAESMPAADVLINLTDDSPACFSRFDRLIEIVTTDDADRERARERFRFYKERGYALETHDLAEK